MAGIWLRPPLRAASDRTEDAIEESAFPVESSGIRSCRAETPSKIPKDQFLKLTLMGASPPSQPANHSGMAADLEKGSSKGRIGIARGILCWVCRWGLDFAGRSLEGGPEPSESTSLTAHPAVANSLRYTKRVSPEHTKAATGTGRRSPKRRRGLKGIEL